MLLFTSGQEVKANEQGRPDCEHHRHYTQKVFNGIQHWFVRNVCGKSCFRKRDIGKIEPRGAAGFIFTKNMVDISLWVLMYSASGSLYQVGSFTKCERALRTCLNTCRRFAIFQSGIVAEETFEDAWMKGTGIFEGGYIKWAGYHACPTPNTDIRIVYDSTLGGLCVGIDKT